MRQANHKVLISLAATVAIGAAGAAVMARAPSDRQDDHDRSSGRRAKNVILFIGDGMGVSTVTATRIFSVGVAGQLVVDQFPYTALSRTYSSDSITADSAPTMTAMMTGYNTNAGVLGLDETTEFVDFNNDGDGKRLWTLLEQAKRDGHAGRRHQHGAHYARDAGRDLRAHQRPQQRERHRAPGAAR